MTDSFIFYKSFHDAIKDWEPEKYGRMVYAINEYALNGTVPDLPEEEARLFILIKPQLDANIQRREVGRLGGRPKAEKTADEEPKKSSPKFQKPTVEEVRQFCAERKYPVDAEHFIAYYESNGWHVGKNPMKNWKSAVLTWARRSFGTPAKAATIQPANRTCPECGQDMLVWSEDDNEYHCTLCGYKGGAK